MLIGIQVFFGYEDCARMPVHPAVATMAYFVPPLLYTVFVCVSFQWNLGKLVYLNMLLQTVSKYHTSVTVCVVTDQPQNLQHVLQVWRFRDTTVCSVPKTEQAQEDNNRYSLLWHHRSVMAEAHRTGEYTSFLYMEDDTKLSWPVLVSWALDTEVLEPLGFTRGFFRTDFSPATGKLVMMDVAHRVNITSWNLTVDVQSINSTLLNTARQRFETYPCFTNDHGSVSPCHIHRLYVQLSNPFHGF